MKYILSILILTICISSVAQFNPNSKVIKYNSKFCQLETLNTNTMEWQTENLFVDHLIVLDFENKKINTYSTVKTNDLDIISQCLMDTKGESDNYTCKCVDSNNKECELLIAYISKKFFFLKLTYTTVKLTYYAEDK